MDARCPMRGAGQHQCGTHFTTARRIRYKHKKRHSAVWGPGVERHFFKTCARAASRGSVLPDPNGPAQRTTNEYWPLEEEAFLAHEAVIARASGCHFLVMRHSVRM